LSTMSAIGIKAPPLPERSSRSRLRTKGAKGREVGDQIALQVDMLSVKLCKVVSRLMALSPVGSNSARSSEEKGIHS
jgi:hypothetical protein